MSRIEFHWFVHEGGYEWSSAGWNGILRPRDTAAKTRGYSLAEFPCLYRDFVAIAKSPEDMLQFANKYGPLFARGGHISACRETPLFWRKQLGPMRLALSYWDTLSSRGPDPCWRGRLAHLVNRNLMRVSQVCPRRKTRRPGPLRPAFMRVFGEGDDRKLGLEFGAFNLIHALWLQVAHLVTGGPSHRRCLTCEKWMDVSTSRTDAVYCGVLCRIAAYRQRIKDAKRLFKDGRNVSQIAEELGTSPTQVAKWVGLAVGQPESVVQT